MTPPRRGRLGRRTLAILRQLRSDAVRVVHRSSSPNAASTSAPQQPLKR